MKKIIIKVVFFILTIGLYSCSSSGGSSSAGGIILQSISINSVNSYTHVGINQQFTATANYSNGTKVDISNQVAWTSSNPLIPIQNTSGKNGLLQALTSGSTLVSAFFNGISTSINYSVSSSTLVSIMISSNTPNIHLGVAQKLSAIGVYSDGMQDISNYVTWSSQNNSIVTVDSNGVITPINIGNSVINATSLIGKSKNHLQITPITSSYNISISSSNLTSISISPNIFTTHLKVPVQYQAVANYADLSSESIINQITWSSSNTTVASIDSQSGLLTPISAGNTTITAIFTTTTGTIVTNTASLVVSNSNLTGIKIVTGDATTYSNINLQFQSQGMYQDGIQDITLATIWQSSNTNVALINNSLSSLNGLAQPITQSSTQNTTVTASFSNNQSGIYTQSSLLSVSTANLASITIIAPFGLLPASSIQYKAVGNFSDGNSIDITKSVNWLSENTSLISISNNFINSGLATSQNNLGSTFIDASLYNISTRYPVTIGNIFIESLAITPSNPTLSLGSSLQLQLTGYLNNGTPLNFTNQSQWSSSNSAIANISTAGLANALSLGITTISAIYNNIILNTKLAVNAKSLSSIQIIPNNPKVALGGTLQLKALGYYSDGSSNDVTSLVTWLESSPNVAIISNTQGSNGLVTPLTNGTSITTAYLANIAASVLLTVVQPFIFATNNVGGKLIECNIDPNNGTILSCFNLINGVTSIWSVGFNNNFLYYSNINGTGGIVVCQLNPNGSVQNCITTASGSFNQPMGMAILNNLFYTANFQGNNITFCNINPNDGTLSGCGNTGAGMNQPNFISIYAGVSGNYAYVINSGVTNELMCPINANGTLGSCSTQAAVSLVSPSGQTIATIGGTTYLYIADGLNLATSKLLQCTISPSTGVITNCINSGATLVNIPAAVTISSNNNLAYITNANIPFIEQCFVNTSTGQFYGCSPYSNSFINNALLGVSSNF